MNKRYANVHDIIRLGWLPFKERQEHHLSKLDFKEIYASHWPEHLKLDITSPLDTYARPVSLN